MHMLEKEWVISKKVATLCMVFQTRQPMHLNLKKGDFKFSYEKYQKYLRLKSENFNNQIQSSFGSSASTTCISQYVEGQGSWIVDIDTSYHIFLLIAF